MYANPLLILQIINYTRAYCIFVYYNLYINISKQLCKCTVQLTEHTSRELSSPLVVLYLNFYDKQLAEKDGEWGKGENGMKCFFTFKLLKSYFPSPTPLNFNLRV